MYLLHELCLLKRSAKKKGCQLFLYVLSFRVLKKLGITRKVVRKALDSVRAKVMEWNPFAIPFARRWDYVEFKQPIMRYISAIVDSTHVYIAKPQVKPVRTPVAILGSLGVCIYVPASRHWLISYSPIHLT